ncbi:unnamed protein product (mitochondrion) [Plasmodiophora brassicae]|uniref:peptide chain release factor N(5)-glutamine methyltransferase n=1 Tax=Plasmodiophora brassicae TaxID=37360 RepID=A0A0G4IYQ1_PLABS|nr:hypothetical protein PBRA_001519 [Plasmodiophora brassicae]SPQ94034.1 unnamed protein product [Plasmodiophora brassicae]
MRLASIQAALRASRVTDCPGQEARWIMEHARSTGKDTADLLRDRLTGKPLQLVLGTQPFVGIDVHCRPGQLIPRPETEQWCAWLAGRVTGSETVLEIGCGTGCISLALASAVPGLSVVAIDASPDAVQQSGDNAAKVGCKSVRFAEMVVGDDDGWVGRVLDLNGGSMFDMVVSNPPYIPVHHWRRLDEGVRRWESPRALCAGHLGLDVCRSIIRATPYLVRPRAASSSSAPSLVIEYGETFQTLRLQQWMRSAGLDLVEAHRDYNGRLRWITGVRT